MDRAGVALEETCALHGELRRWVPERSHGRHSGRASPAHRRQPESVNGSRRHKRPRAPLANARRDPGFFWKIYSQDPYWRLVLAEGPANASRRDPGFPPQVPSQDPYWRLASARARQRVAWGSGFLLEDLQSGSLLCAGAWDGTLLVLASVRIPEVVARGAAFQRRRGAAAATWRAAVRCRTTENDAQRARSRACTQSPRHEEVPGGGTKPLIRTSSPSLFLFRNRTKPGRADSRAHRRGLRSRDRGTRPGSRTRGA